MVVATMSAIDVPSVHHRSSNAPAKFWPKNPVIRVGTSTSDATAVSFLTISFWASVALDCS